MGHREDHEAGWFILAPFAGYIIAILAVVLEGYTVTGIKVMGEYDKAGQERIAQELEQAV